MIIMYHKVDIVTPTKWWVSPDKFAQHMEALSKLDVVYLEDYNAGDTSQCVITFDDCYENIYRHAFPILKEYGYPFEIFMIGKYSGKWNKFDLSEEPPTRFCNLEQLKEMACNGARVQWHTADHVDLTSVPLSKALRQMVVPDRFRALFSPPHFSWFAYPYGALTPQVVALARSLFQGAVAVENGSYSTMHQLKRVVAHEELDMSALIEESLYKTESRIELAVSGGDVAAVKKLNREHKILRRQLAKRDTASAIAALELHDLLAKSLRRYRQSEQRYLKIVNSASWRISAPIRYLATRSPQLRSLVRAVKRAVGGFRSG